MGFEVGHDRADVSAFHYASSAEVLVRVHDDGAGNSYFVLGDGLDSVFLVGVQASAMIGTEFLV